MRRKAFYGNAINLFRTATLFRAKNRIEIKKDGAVTGDLTTQQILIEVGAIYKGSIETEEKGVDMSAMSAATASASSSARPTAAA